MKLQAMWLSSVLVLILTAAVVAQESALPAGWESLSADEFAKAVEKQKSQGPLAPELKGAIAKQAVALLFKTDQALDQLSYSDLGKLLRYGEAELSAEQRARLQQQLASRTDDSMEFPVMRNKVAVMSFAGMKDEAKKEFIASWVRSGKLEATHPDLSPADASWLYKTLSQPYLANGSFSVKWSGNVRAPRTGKYTFSLDPANPNAKWRRYLIEIDWKITVDGAEVLRATPEKWVTESRDVELTADQPVKFLAEGHFHVSRPIENQLSAILSWRGPGISTSIVPNECWTTPDGSAAGLSAEYQAVFAGAKEPQTISRIDPAIDFNWTSDRILVSRYAKEQQLAVNYFWEQFMSPAFLEKCASRKAEHPFLMRSEVMAECLNTSQRRAFLKEAQQRNAMLSPLNRHEGTKLFLAYRLGAEKEALDAYGTWCLLHSSLVPGMPRRATQKSLFDKNRMVFAHLAHRLNQEYPAMLKPLEDKYLQAEDGSCSLPAAYTLAYAYQVQKKIDVWIRLLELKLADPRLSGGQRVNWLLARAMAEELRHTSADRYSVDLENLSAGINWLKSAQESAATDAQRLLVLKEFIVRDMALNRFDVAKTRLEMAAGAMQKDSAQAAIRRTGAQIDRITAAIHKGEETDAVAAVTAYRSEIERRQQMATASGDSAEAARLGQLLEKGE